jgi:predicted alpha-1,6-mannanase (GH76 family)
MMSPHSVRSGPIAAAALALAQAATGCSASIDPTFTHTRAGGNGGGGVQGSSSTGAGGGAGLGGQSGSVGASPDASMFDAGPFDASAEPALDGRARGDAFVTSPDAPWASDAIAPGGSISVPPPILNGCDGMTAQTRADRSIAQLMFGLWNGSANYLDASEPTNNNRTGYWTFAEAFDSVIDGVERTGGRRYLGLIQTLYQAQNGNTWRSDYYDDESWMALSLIRAYDLTKNRAYLDRAVALYAEIEAAWDATSAHPGGIWWNRPHTQKATASNGGPVIIGARLTARTGDPAYLTFARQVYTFWRTNMTDAATYETYDHMSPDGTIGKGRLTYNEGIMSGAALALYAATGEAQFRADGHGFATRLAKFITKSTPQGPVLADGTNTSCTRDCPQWKGIGYRYLASAFRDDPTRPDYLPVLQGSVGAAWTLARNTTTGYFANDWAGPPMSTAAIEAQSSTATALNLYATLCGSYVPPPDAAYEAEDAVLDHVGVEETNAGFSGWGYVSSWSANNQFVEFSVSVGAAGSYRLDFDYAAATQAARALLVGGAMTLPKLTFPATAGVGTWGRTSATVTLGAGPNAIRLVYLTANGSVAPLNLDRMVVTPL